HFSSMARRRGSPVVGPERAGLQQRGIPPAVISVRACGRLLLGRSRSQVAARCRNVAKRSAERLLADANAAARTNLMRPPPDLLLRRGQLGPALADEWMQLGFEASAEVDRRRQRALSDVRMRRRRHAGDAHAGRPDGHLQVRIVALVALERPALAHAPDVWPLVSRLAGVLYEARPQAHARV